MSIRVPLLAAFAVAALLTVPDFAAAQATVRVDAPRAGFRLWNRRPWFGNTNIRRQLKLDDTQYNRLNQGYVQYWTPYHETVTALPADINEAERQKRLAEAYGTFNRGFTKTTGEVFTDPQIRDRYNQLNLQYQGYAAFNDPTVQERLRLTDEQRQAFHRYYNDWNKQMDTYAREYPTNREVVTKEWPNTWKQTRERINTTLTPEQRRTWTEMIGEPYEFTPDVYFDNGDRDGDRK
jgi:hypothetical protein